MVGIQFVFVAYEILVSSAAAAAVDYPFFSFNILNAEFSPWREDLLGLASESSRFCSTEQKLNNQTSGQTQPLLPKKIIQDPNPKTTRMLMATYASYYLSKPIVPCINSIVPTCKVRWRLMPVPRPRLLPYANVQPTPAA